MNNRIISTLSQKYWKKTGQYTMPSWKKNLPSGWEIWLHDSPNLPLEIDNYLECKDKSTWIENARKIATTKKQPPGFMKEWEKFCHKSFAQWEAYERNPKGLLIWIDSDVKFKRPITEEVLKKCLNDKFCAYLGRDRVDTQDPFFKKRYGQYETLTPETCFIIYNLDHHLAEDFFKEFKKMYFSREIFNNYSWCDAGSFISTVQKFDKQYFNDITANDSPTPLPLNISILDPYIEHWIGTKNKKEKQDVIGLEYKEFINASNKK